MTEVAINTLTNPAMYLGENIAQIMAFGRLLDSYTPDQLRYIHSHAPSSMWDYEYVDELAGFAINEIQTFGQKRGRQRLYFLPKFFDDRGKPLTLDWLKSHPAPNYSPKVFPESVA